MRAALAAGLDFFAASPELAKLLLTEPFVAGPSVSRRYQAEIGGSRPFLRDGPRALRRGRRLSRHHRARPVGSIASQVGRKVSAGEAEELPRLLPDLTQFALSPYLGAAEAREIARRKRP